MKTIFGFLVLAAVVGGVFALNTVTKTKEGKSVLDVAGEQEVSVEIAAPEQGDIIRTVQAPGEVEALAEVDISAEVVGKILEMPVEEGDGVQKGDLLCRLDDADYRARVRSAEAHVAKLTAAVAQADADYEKADRDFRRQKELSEANATSAIELDDYNTTFKRAKATVDMRKEELKQADADLQSAHEDLEKTIITAPITGVVSQRFAKQGEVVITGTMNNLGTRIMVVSDLSKMQVRCRVDETDAPLVKPDQVARLYLQSDTQKSHPGHVLRVATKGTKPVGRDVVTFETLVMVDSDDPRIKPGMTVNVEIEVARSDNALTIPVQAVVNRKRRDLPKELVEAFDHMRERSDARAKSRAAEYVPVVWAVVDGKADPRLMEAGISDDLRVEVLQGVAVGEQVITGPFRSVDQLKKGSKIKIEEKEKEKDKEPDATAAEDKSKGDEKANSSG